MRLFKTIAGLHCYLDLAKTSNTAAPAEIGLVPTMGALHPGHLSLIERAKQENDLVIVSIFVNPLQFGPSEDWQNYPRELEKDYQLCEQAKVDVIFIPSVETLGMESLASSLEISPTDSLSAQLTKVTPPDSMTSVLCGNFRPGHFTGVATIVIKLLNVVQPNRAYFGEKDAQQLAIIKKLAIDLNIPVEIIGCPIYREPSGLAYSSRNQYLSVSQKENATILYQSLQAAKAKFNQGERSASPLISTVKDIVSTIPSIKLEYVELVDPNNLIPLEKINQIGLLALAARVGPARLIDNIILKNRRPMIVIDGPAGAGKSTVTKLVAKELGLTYLDTGAMYRAVTWLVLQNGINIDDEAGIAELVSQCVIEFSSYQEINPQIRINGKNVMEAIRSLEVTATVSQVAAYPAVRQKLVQQQQKLGQLGGLIAEGRDLGTYVFPDAEVKIFLTASVQARARRRFQELISSGYHDLTIEQLEIDLAVRDKKDSTRRVSPLRKAADAIEIMTDNLTINEVTAQIVNLFTNQHQ